MTVKTKIIAINKLLSDIYQKPMRLSYLLVEVNFTEEDIRFIANQLLTETINNFLDSLEKTLLNCRDGKRLFEILNTVYGLDGNPPQTLQTIGEDLEISRERVRQLKNKALQKLKANRNISQIKNSFQIKTVKLIKKNAGINDISSKIQYKFLINQSESGHNYITISNNQNRDTIKEIIITEETVQDFYNEFIETIKFIGWQNFLTIRQPFKIKNIKQKYSRAYEKWTSEEEAILVSKFKQKMSIEQIALSLERQPSAINSRLQKLGLK